MGGAKVCVLNCCRVAKCNKVAKLVNILLDKYKKISTVCELARASAVCVCLGVSHLEPLMHYGHTVLFQWGCL